MTKTKRLITFRQEQALRCCHHDFQHLSRSEAAIRMKISQATLYRLLVKVKKVLPQYFPILTKLETKDYHYYVNEGWTIKQIAEYTQRSENAVYRAFGRARKKGMFFPKAKSNFLSYDPNMDIEVKEKF